MTRLAIAAALTASTAALLAQEGVPYCAVLKEINNHAMSRDRFAPLIGKPREAIIARPRCRCRDG
jgi:hypothetical protein